MRWCKARNQPLDLDPADALVFFRYRCSGAGFARVLESMCLRNHEFFFPRARPAGLFANTTIKRFYRLVLHSDPRFLEKLLVAAREWVAQNRREVGTIRGEAQPRSTCSTAVRHCRMDSAVLPGVGETKVVGYHGQELAEGRKAGPDPCA